jgi:hypothetical protein
MTVVGLSKFTVNTASTAQLGGSKRYSICVLIADPDSNVAQGMGSRGSLHNRFTMGLGPGSGPESNHLPKYADTKAAGAKSHFTTVGVF